MKGSPLIAAMAFSAALLLGGCASTGSGVASAPAGDSRHLNGSTDVTSPSVPPEDSLAAVLDPVQVPQGAADAAPVLLTTPSVREALVRDLRSLYSDTSDYPTLTTLTTTVFVPYGAVAADEVGKPYTVYGAACTAYWSILGVVPSLDYRHDVPVALDVRTDGHSAQILAVRPFSTAYLDHQMEVESSATLAVPGWVLDRTPQLDPGWPELTDHRSDDMTVRLVREWVISRLPEDASRSLPKGYTGSPHAHPGIGRLQELSAAQRKLVFRSVPEGKLRGFADVSHADRPIDFSGPGKGGPVKVFTVTWNDPGDYVGIVNTRTGRALTVTGAAWLTNASWRGRILSIDLVTDNFVGSSRSLLHCEIDWKTMAVLRVVPYGPLSPFEPTR